MAGMIRRGEGALGRPRSAWDPLEQMRELLQFDPFRELGFGVPSLPEGQALMPSFEVKEKKDAIVLKADLPGVKEQDLDISLQDNRVVISGKREAEKREEGETLHTYECSYGTFSRSFTLPEGIDAEHVNAELKDGVLTLYFPKRKETQPKKIELGGKGKAKA